MKKFIVLLAIPFLLFGMFGTASALSISEIEPNNTLATAQNIDPFFSLAANGDILNATTIPWVSISATGDGSYDYYSFTVFATSTAYFDIDYGMNQGGSMDTELAVWRSNGTVVAQNDDYSTSAGAGGSIHSYDSWLSLTLTPGLYYVGVAEYNAYAYTGGWSGNAPDSGDTYTLQVSVQYPTPEPATMLLLGAGLIGLAAARRRRTG